MKTLILTLSLLLSLSLFADGHHHKHEKSNHKATNQKSFETTKDLHERMVKIRQMIKEKKKKEISNEEVKVLSKNILKTVDDIFKTCTLPEEADHALHPILEKVINGAKKLETGDTKTASIEIRTALKEYKNLFKIPKKNKNHQKHNQKMKKKAKDA